MSTTPDVVAEAVLDRLARRGRVGCSHRRHSLIFTGVLHPPRPRCRRKIREGLSIGPSRQRTRRPQQAFPMPGADSVPGPDGATRRTPTLVGDDSDETRSPDGIQFEGAKIMVTGARAAASAEQYVHKLTEHGADLIVTAPPEGAARGLSGRSRCRRRSSSPRSRGQKQRPPARENNGEPLTSLVANAGAENDGRLEASSSRGSTSRSTSTSARRSATTQFAPGHVDADADKQIVLIGPLFRASSDAERSCTTPPSFSPTRPALSLVRTSPTGGGDHPRPAEQRPRTQTDRRGSRTSSPRAYRPSRRRASRTASSRRWIGSRRVLRLPRGAPAGSKFATSRPPPPAAASRRWIRPDCRPARVRLTDPLPAAPTPVGTASQLHPQEQVLLWRGTQDSEATAARCPRANAAGASWPPSPQHAIPHFRCWSKPSRSSQRRRPASPARARAGAAGGGRRPMPLQASGAFRRGLPRRVGTYYLKQRCVASPQPLHPTERFRPIATSKIRYLAPVHRWPAHRRRASPSRSPGALAGLAVVVVVFFILLTTSYTSLAEAHRRVRHHRRGVRLHTQHDERSVPAAASASPTPSSSSPRSVRFFIVAGRRRARGTTSSASRVADRAALRPVLRVPP